ncbi:hypothetical protein DCAR_0832351 [Daucus carota subsp. sativus]|uniref:F-box domain-containing protein n=1 Tax=Daucus carota subsp. sativus TaxID=79200 RepID=A0AAF0XT50_DAUCS|nr:hypothetical protein DCAR_0832351 [Daucus carota subsp. sativus]
MNEKNKRKRSWETVLSEFTDDLWTEILLRLPIKTLLQFKSVSKSWFSIISSHRFATSHLAMAAKDDQILIAHHDVGDYEMEDENSFSLFHLGSGRILKNLGFPFSQGEYPSTEEFSRLIGSDCGIVCVYVSVSAWRATKQDVDIYLWNPATKHSKILPPHTTVLDHRSNMALGFGFDHVDLDFKLVRVVPCDLSAPVHSTEANLAEIYSSNRNAWRKIEPKPSDVPNESRFRLCLPGFLFAIGYNGLIVFDINKEVLICDIKLPFSSSEKNYYPQETHVRDFKDTIAVILSIMYKRKISLWTLDDKACLAGVGVEASWTKLHVIDVGVRVVLFEGLFNGVQLLLSDEDDNRLLYDLNNKATTNVHIPDFFVIGGFFKHTNSLFSLEGFKRIKWAVEHSEIQMNENIAD